MTPAERERDALDRARTCDAVTRAHRQAIRAILHDIFVTGGVLVRAPQWTPPDDGVDAVSTPRGPSPVEAVASCSPPETRPRFSPSVPLAIFEGLR